MSTDDSEDFFCYFCDIHCGESQRKFIEGLPENVCDECLGKLDRVMPSYGPQRIATLEAQLVEVTREREAADAEIAAIADAAATWISGEPTTISDHAQRISVLKYLLKVAQDKRNKEVEQDAEISRLRALVAVGREMADAIETYSYGVRAIAAKWRSLEGER